jgi:hypothetical protein
MPFLNSFEVSEGASRTSVDTTEMAWQFCSKFSKEEFPKSLISAAIRPLPKLLYHGCLLLVMWMTFI